MTTWFYEHRYLKNTDTIYHGEWSASGNGKNSRALIRFYKTSSIPMPIHYGQNSAIYHLLFSDYLEVSYYFIKRKLHPCHYVTFQWCHMLQSCDTNREAVMSVHLTTEKKYITWCIWQKSIYEIVDLTDKMCTKDDVRFVWITRCSFSLWFFVYIIVICQKVYSHICLCFENINLECYHLY